MKIAGRQWVINGEGFDVKKKQNVYMCATMVFSVLVIVIVAFLKWQGTNINYKNSDATWHTLLTMQAYDETPVSVHKFVPIVTIGGERDKGIPWGDTIPDEKGNYYYTSYSPMGYVLPYLFVKILHLPFSEKSLFCFNTLLLLVSCVVIILLFREIYGEKCNYLFLAIIMFCYIISPEIMHGMGIVYWHQSVMQILIPLQCLAYYRYIKKEDKISKILFYMLCVINPYTEWSGFVANGGFFIAELIRNCKKKGIGKIIPSFFIGIWTVVSFAIFCIHYLCVVSINDLFTELKNRFLARNIATTIPLHALLSGYKESFAALLVITGIFAVVWIYAKKSENKLMIEDKLLLFVSAFPVVENFIMKEHAISYTYDRMKLALPLMLILYWLLTHIQIERKAAKFTAVVLPIVCSIYLAVSYFSGDVYFWNIDYRLGNEKLCKYLNENYDNSVYGMDSAVRGYVNLTLGHGCYEFVSNIFSLEPTAGKEGRRYLVMLSSNNEEGKNTWNAMYSMDALVYDREKKEEIVIHNTGSDIKVSLKKDPTVFKLAKVTNSNWTSGVKATDNKVVRFDYHPALLEKVENNKYIKANKKFYQIVDYEYNYNWITVTVDQDATGLAYPKKIKFTDKKQ